MIILLYVLVSRLLIICNLINLRRLHGCPMRRILLNELKELFVISVTFFKMAESENIIKEGRAEILFTENIFYNPVQEFNRDMSVVALSVYAEEFKNKVPDKPTKRRRHCSTECSNPSMEEVKEDGITVVEALSATGLRSIRYALEVPHVSKIYANDCSARAVQTINRNIQENKVGNVVIAENYDAVWLMQKLKFENKSVHAIDLDPYGCPTKFLDSAINCVADGGLLMITCTDMAVIAGNTPESCYLKYGAVSLRNGACHEMALRIALQAVASHCGRYGKYIVPLLSFSADFYVRIFVRVFYNQHMSKRTSSNLSMVYQCCGCEMITLHPLGKMKPKENGQVEYFLPRGPPVSEKCVHCGHAHKIGGPIWSGPLYDDEFIDKMLTIARESSLNTNKRMIGMLTLIKEELKDVPLYYIIDNLCRKVHCEPIPSVIMRYAILNAGYNVSLSHCKTNSIKTNAPQSFIWDVIRSWVKKNPVSKKRLEKSDVATMLLSQEPQFEINFAKCKNATPNSLKEGLLRYQPNPLPFWGPGSRSKSRTLLPNQSSKSERNQNKKARLKVGNESHSESEINAKNDEIVQS